MAYPINHYPNDRFADRLQAECARLGLGEPTASLPDRLGYDASSVRQWLLGCTRPGSHSLGKLAGLFGVPVEEWRGLLDGDQRRVCPDCRHALLDADGACPACRERTRARRITRERLKIWKEEGLPFEIYLDGWYKQGRPFADWLRALERLGIG